MTATAPAGEHDYVSTACHHEIQALAAGDVERAAELHAYCEADSGKGGAKKPAHCKWCDAQCQCPRHVPGAVPVAWSPGAAETERVLREKYADLVGPGAYKRLRKQMGLGDILDGEVVAQQEMERHMQRLPGQAALEQLRRRLKQALRDQVDEAYGITPELRRRLDCEAPGWAQRPAEGIYPVARDDDSSAPAGIYPMPYPYPRPDMQWTPITDEDGEDA